MLRVASACDRLAHPTLAIEFPDGETRTVPRTTTQPVRSITGRLRAVTQSARGEYWVTATVQVDLA